MRDVTHRRQLPITGLLFQSQSQSQSLSQPRMTVPFLLKFGLFCIYAMLFSPVHNFPSPSLSLFAFVHGHPVSLSEWNSCFLDPAGRVHCWSTHTTRSRKLDNVTQIEANLNQNPPQAIRTANFTSIRGGRAHTCGVLYPSSRLVCWGSNFQQQLEIHPFVANQSIQAYDVGEDFTCAQLSRDASPAGGWYCWGRKPNSMSSWPTPFAPNGGLWTAVIAGIGRWLCTLYQIGNNNQKYVIPSCIGDDPPLIPDSEYVNLNETTYLLDWATGSDFFCVLLSDHSQRCYGSNEWGAFNLQDIPTGDGECQLLTAAVGALCCLLDDGSILCAGRSLEGQTAAPQIGVYTDIVCRYYTCCSVTNFGFIKCWGDQGDLANQFAGPRYLDLNAGVNQMLAQLPSGRLIGWGDNSGHRLDIPDGITDWISFSTGNDKSCGIRAQNNQIICWGNWAATAVTTTFIPPPTGDAAMGWRVITVGLQHACGILVNGRVSCFGSNANGQTNVPEDAVTALAPMKNCDASIFHTCCIGTNGVSSAGLNDSLANSAFIVSANALCFGSNRDGQLQIPWLSYQTMVMSNLTWTHIAVGTSHSVGLLSNGSMRAWGDNIEGQCNVPTQADIASNPQLQNLDIVDRNTTTGELLYSDPHAGAYHSCGILVSKRVVCFGYDLYGQASNPYPTMQFSKLNLAGAFTAGIDLHNQTLFMWGVDNLGQLQQPIVEVLAAPVGYYRSVAGEVKRCLLASFSLGMGASGSHCSGVCAPGRYGGTNTSIIWRNPFCAGPCPIGNACPAGSELPVLCNKTNPAWGEWQSQPGKGSCDNCTAPGSTFGAYVDATRTQCGWYGCPGGTAPSANGCELCPPGQAAVGGPDPCRDCTAGTYNYLYNASRCTQCPTGTDGEGLDCSRSQAQVRPGFWALRVNKSEIVDAVEKVVGHLRLYACAPGLCDGEPDPLSLFSPCSENRSREPNNTLCGQCIPGYTYWNEACVKCNGVNYGLIFLIVLSSFLLVGVLHALMNSSKRRTRATSVSLAAVNVDAHNSSSLHEYESESASAVDVALNFGQASWIQFYRSVGFQAVLAFLSFDQRGTTGSTCLAPLSAVANLASPAAVPFILFAELALIACGQAGAVYLVTRRTVRSRQPKRDSNEHASISLPVSSDAATEPTHNTASSFPSKSSSEDVSTAANNICLIWLVQHCQRVKWHNYVNTTIMLLTFSFQQTVRVCLRYLNCFQVEDSLVVYTAPAINCRSDEYKRWMPLVIIILILELGFFAALVGVVLMKYRRERASLRTSGEKRPSATKPSLEAPSPPIAATKRKSNISTAATSSVVLPVKAASFSSSSSKLTLSRVPSVATAAVAPTSPVAVQQDVSTDLQSTSTSPTVVIGPVSTMTLEARFRVLFAPYSSHAYYWCVWDMFRRTALILIDTFILDHQSRSLALVYFNMLCLVVQLIVRPYVSTITNRLEVMSLSILVVLSVAMLSSPTTTSTTVEWLVVAGVVCGLVIMIFFVLVLYSHQWEELRPQLLAPVISLQATLRSMIFGSRTTPTNLQKQVQASDVVVEMQSPADVRTKISASPLEDVSQSSGEVAAGTLNQRNSMAVVEGDHDLADSIDDYGRRPMSGGRLSDTIETLGSNREQQFLSNATSTHHLNATQMPPRPSVSNNAASYAIKSNTVEAGSKKVHLPTFNDDALMTNHPTALRFSDAAATTRTGLFRDSICETPATRPELSQRPPVPVNTSTQSNIVSAAADSIASNEPAQRRSMADSDLLPASHTESDPTLHSALRDRGLLLDSEADPAQDSEFKSTRA